MWVYTEKPEDNLGESVLSPHYVDPGDDTKELRLSGSVAGVSIRPPIPTCFGHYLVQGGLKLSASVSSVQRLKHCATAPGLGDSLLLALPQDWC